MLVSLAEKQNMQRVLLIPHVGYAEQVCGSNRCDVINQNLALDLRLCAAPFTCCDREFGLRQGTQPRVIGRQWYQPRSHVVHFHGCGASEHKLFSIFNDVVLIILTVFSLLS